VAAPEDRLGLRFHSILPEPLPEGGL